MFGACDRGGVLELYNVQHGTCTVQSYSIAVAVGMHCRNIGGSGMHVHLHAGGTTHVALLSHARTPVQRHIHTRVCLQLLLRVNRCRRCLGLTAAAAVQSE